MYLNSSLLFDELGKVFSVASTGPSGYAVQLRHPLLYRRGMELRPDCIYVGKGEEFDEGVYIPGSCCIVSAGPLPESYAKSNAFCIVADRSLEVSMLLNQIQMIFETFEQWKNHLESLIQHNCTMQEFLEQCQPYFPGNFLLLVDANWRVLATTARLSYVMDSTGHTPADVVTRFKKDPTYIKMRFHREPFLYRGLYFDHDILICNILFEDELVGNFSLAQQEMPITDGKRSLFAQLVNMVTQLYRQQFYIRPSEIEPSTVFSKILNGAIVSRTDISRSIKSIGWKEDDEFIACVIQVHESDKKIRSISYLCQQIEALMPYAVAVEHNSDIILVLNRTRDAAQQEKSKGEFHAFLRSTMLRAGLSRPFHDLLCLGNFCEQAKAALGLSAPQSSERPCCYFSDYVLDYMLCNLNGNIEGESLCPDGLLTLRELDKKHGSAYIQTLRTYFETGLNASRSAKELYINRSTFLARMDKICSTLDMTLEDSDTRLYLMLCLKLLGT